MKRTFLLNRGKDYFAKNIQPFVNGTSYEHSKDLEPRLFSLPGH